MTINEIEHYKALCNGCVSVAVPADKLAELIKRMQAAEAVIDAFKNYDSSMSIEKKIRRWHDALTISG